MALELPEGWRDELPEEIKTNGVLNDITTIDQLATFVVKARQNQSNQISIPSEDASPERRDEFLKDLQSKIPDLAYVGEGADMSTIYDRMGRPKESGEYELGELPDPLKENFADLTAKAHELGLSQKQMSGLTDTIRGDFEKNMNQSLGAVEKENDAIKAEWGTAADGKKEVVSGFVKQLGFTDEFADAIKSGQLGKDNILALDKMMEGFDSPGPRIGDHQDTLNGNVTPGQAEEQLNDIMSNKEHPYWEAASPAHDTAIKKVIDLTRIADSGKVASESEQFRDALAGRG